MTTSACAPKQRREKTTKKTNKQRIQRGALGTRHLRTFFFFNYMVGWGDSVILGQIFAEKCMKMNREVGRQWRFQDFPRWGCQPSGEGAPPYDFAKFYQKLHEIERIWTPRWGHPSRPVRSANGRGSVPSSPLDPLIRQMVLTAFLKLRKIR